MGDWVFRLPMPPSTNNLFVNVQGVGRVKGKKYTAWISAAKQWLTTQKRPAEPITYRINMDISVPRVKRGRADISNRIKAVEDICVTSRILKDDSLVERITAEWFDGRDCIVRLSSAEDAARRVA
jgi:Holliday junction resolvase RusA-like endonuclease